MLMPCWTKKVGSQSTKPKISVLIDDQHHAADDQPRQQLGAEQRGKLKARHRHRRPTRRRQRPAARASVSISASAPRPRPRGRCASSQRGDSGSALRRYQTISAPTPAITNIGRQPKCRDDQAAEHRGRREAGHDDERHERQPAAARSAAARTRSGSSSRPRSRRRGRAPSRSAAGSASPWSGAKAAANEARPKTTRLNW